MTSAAVPVPRDTSRARAMNRLRRGDVLFHNITFAAAVFVLVMMTAVVVSLVIGAWPAIRAFGFGFLTSQSWNPVTENFGAILHLHLEERPFFRVHRRLPELLRVHLS